MFCADIRQRGRFAGFSLYASDTDVSSIVDIKGSTLCYKDGPELPTLNFTTICTKFGRYVIFYNERLQEVKYPDLYQLTNVVTELCEVTVQGKWIYKIIHNLKSLCLTKITTTNVCKLKSYRTY